jgi:hypothetical protein
MSQSVFLLAAGSLRIDAIAGKLPGLRPRRLYWVHVLGHQNDGVQPREEETSRGREEWRHGRRG